MKFLHRLKSFSMVELVLVAFFFGFLCGAFFVSIVCLSARYIKGEEDRQDSDILDS